MNEIARKRIGVALLLGAVTVLLGTAGITWRRRAVNLHWQAALVEARLAEARLLTWVDRRQALWGETTDELAQPHYDQALALVAGWDVDAVWEATQNEDERAREARQAFVAEGSHALEALHRGAHASDATWAVDWSLGFYVPQRKLMHTRLLSQLCEMKAALLFEEGRELEAVGVLLDALQLAGDLSRSPLMIEEIIGGALLSPNFLVEGVADGTLLALSQDAHERLVAGVSALDRRLSWQVRSFESELVLTARGLEQAFQEDGGGGLEWAPEGSLSSIGRTQDLAFAAEHLHTMNRLCEEYEQAFRAGPAALFAEIERFPELADFENPISALVLPKFDSAYRGRLYSLGRFRLLAHALSGDEEPRDPWLAEFLRAEESEAGTRLWLSNEVFGQLEVHVAR